MDNVTQIFGAPGCGKTTFLMSILEDELERVKPHEVAFVSFTRKGTYEGAERAARLFNLEPNALPYFRTLHSIAFRHGEYSKHDMLDRHDYKVFSTAMGMKFTGYYSEDFFNTEDDKYLFMHFLKRNNPAAAERVMDDVDARVLADVEHNFQRYKKFASVHDFTDIIERFVAAKEPLPVKVAIIDEAQDLTTLQWNMCEVAFANCDRIYVAGDDDQAIYEWSGADVSYFLNLHPRERKILDKSYRLRRNVLDFASRITGLMKKRVAKEFDPIDDGGEVLFHNTLADVHIVPGESYYFLARNNWFLQYYRDHLRQTARVFSDKDVPSVNPKHIEAINAFERAKKRGKLTDIEEMKLKLLSKNGIDLSKPWFEVLDIPNDLMAYYKDLIKYKVDVRASCGMVNTIHGVKGGEADNVVVMMDFTRAVRKNMERNPDSELRCLYVACTRAKKRLHIVHSSSKNGYDDFIGVEHA